jgi:hypothetical protein
VLVGVEGLSSTALVPGGFPITKIQGAKMEKAAKKGEHVSNMRFRRDRVRAIAGLMAVPLLWPATGFAIDFTFDAWGNPVEGVLNNTATLGASWRLEERKDYLVGKGSLDPDVCAGVYQACQGLQRLQNYPAEKLRRSPGMASNNFDDGNLNYDKGDIVQAPFKFNQDLTLTSGKFGLFLRTVMIYDHPNYHNFQQNQPNLITPENADRVAFNGVVGLGGDQIENRYLPRVFGRGEPTRFERTDDEALDQLGFRYDILDANIFGSFTLPGERELLVRLGRQQINWGESTVSVINSVNQVNPVNANSLYRVGFGLLEELFSPVGMLRASTEIVDGLGVDVYYQYEWEPIEIPTAGSFMSFADVGSYNQVDNINASFGGSAVDPEAVGAPLNNPLSTIAPTTLTLDRRPDNNARDQGQYGISFKYYAEWLNNGTDLSFYFANYHSKLPYVSAYAADASCARREGNALGRDSSNTFELLNDAQSTLGVTNLLVNDVASLLAQSPLTAADFGLETAATPLQIINGLAGLLTPKPGEPLSNAVTLDSVDVQLEYPENLKMYGFSFNTTYGEYSFQGELAYRPKVPLQVAIVDVAFTGLGPTLTRCDHEELNCAGSTNTLGFTEDGGAQYSLYPSNNFTDENGNNPYPDNINLFVGSAPGSRRSFPSFLEAYRGIPMGETAPNSYVRGWIPGKVMQYTLGATRVLGASENWFGADQIILLPEIAATHVLNMPDFDELQIEGPLSATTHASAGAEGSGADGSRLACANNKSCTFGPDGLRFNPFQARRDAFADAFSWGYRLVALTRYESVFPGISIAPLFIWQHDIKGNAPGPGGNFVEGRKTLFSILEFRYEKSFAFNITYNAFFGGGQDNLYQDRDNLGFFVKYQF